MCSVAFIESLLVFLIFVGIIIINPSYKGSKGSGDHAPSLPFLLSKIASYKGKLISYVHLSINLLLNATLLRCQHTLSQRLLVLVAH